MKASKVFGTTRVNSIEIMAYLRERVGQSVEVHPIHMKALLKMEKFMA